MDRVSAVAFLERDPLRRIVPLKMIASFPDAVSVRHWRGSGGEGVLVRLRTAAYAFDRATYPGTEVVTILASDGPAASAALLDEVDPSVPTVFKLADRGDGESVRTRFGCRRITAFLTYSTGPDEGRDPVPGDPPVRETAAFDPDCAPLYAAQGHEADEVQGLFADFDARAFTARGGGGAPLASCLTFRNFRHIHELGALFTIPAARRGGLARRVATAALASLARRGLVPRYQVHEDNAASIALAGRIGLSRVVAVEHWLSPNG